MRAFISTIILLFSAQAFSVSSSCNARKEYRYHQTFCNNLDEITCSAHSAICRFSVFPTEEESCYPNRGQEAHLNFCESLDLFQCTQHSQVCRWIYEYYDHTYY